MRRIRSPEVQTEPSIRRSTSVSRLLPLDRNGRAETLEKVLSSGCSPRGPHGRLRGMEAGAESRGRRGVVEALAGGLQVDAASSGVRDGHGEAEATLGHLRTNEHVSGVAYTPGS